MASNKQYIKRHRTWQQYAEKELAAGRKPIKFKDFGTDSIYFHGMNRVKTESRLKHAGLTEKEIAKFKRKSK